MYYKVVIEAGQMRAGENFQVIRHIEADNAVHLFDLLEEMPGLLTEDLGYSVTMVKAVSREEFLAGRQEEESRKVLLRMHVRFQIRRSCLIVLPHGGTSLTGETVDLSAGGVGITLSGEGLQRGMTVKVTIAELQLIEKPAEVVWTSERGDVNAAGLRWLQV